MAFVTFRTLFLVITSVVCIGSLVAACSSGGGKASSRAPKVVRVASGNSIQVAVNKSVPGDVILIAAGTYSGEVVVQTNDITLRGADRNDVIIDGNYEQDNGIIVAANGVRVQNLTVQKFRTNGVLVQGGYDSGDASAQSSSATLARYSVEYVNALNNGLYGIYAFSSTDGTIANTYTAANADAGIYVGQCKPCRSVVHDNDADTNGIGYQGANASKDISVYSNTFSNNRTGIHVLSETKELKSPQEDVVVASNIVNDNNNANAPTTTPELFGFGIVVAGGTNNVIENNRVDSNDQVGIALVEQHDFLPSGNTFRGNNATGNGSLSGFDLAFTISGRPDVMSLGNCFANNTFATSTINNIESVLPCTGAAPGPFASTALKDFTPPAAPDYSKVGIGTQTHAQMTNNPKELLVLPKRLTRISQPDLTNLAVPTAQ